MFKFKYLKSAGMDNRGSIPGRGYEGIFLFATTSTPALGPTHPIIQRVPGGFPWR
jgi:hypothetical protein